MIIPAEYSTYVKAFCVLFLVLYYPACFYFDLRRIRAGEQAIRELREFAKGTDKRGLDARGMLKFFGHAP